MMSPTSRNTDLSLLHPVFRQKAQAVLDRLTADQIPFRIFEAYRSPQRQQFLFSQGRTAPGAIVTKAKAWQSYHQYGFAADFVLFVDGQWSWDTSGSRAACWDRLAKAGVEMGLEQLSFELPHLQLAGLRLEDLQAGRYPPGGDDSWAEGMETVIATWSDQPPAPPLPDVLPQRPPLEAESHLVFINRFGGREWCVTPDGILVREGGNTQLMRSRGEPQTCRAILEICGPAIRNASAKHGVVPELIMMTIATETGFARKQGFTGPATFRWEPHVKVTDLGGERFGDYSAGPMQTLASTARALIRKHKLTYDPLATAPPFESRPEPPASHPLYDLSTAIELGTVAIKDRLSLTGGDPILVSATYNCGGIRESDANPWRLVCQGDHLDRAASWYGDACTVLRGA